MNTIFWLAVFCAVCSYGYFFINWLALWATSKGWAIDKTERSMKEYLAVKHYGVFYFMQFRWFFIGVGFTILAVTI